MLKKNIPILILLFFFWNCKAIKMTTTNKSQIIYDGSITENKKAIIRFVEYRDCKTYTISIYDNFQFEENIEFKVCPTVSVIDKIPKGNTNYLYRAVTDTFQNQFKCFEYKFLERYCTKEIKNTFVQLKSEERILFEKLSQILGKNNGFSFTLSDAENIQGWVKIDY